MRELGAANWDIFKGSTTTASRLIRARQAICAASLQDSIVGQNSKQKKPETFAQLFERIYGTRLAESTPTETQGTPKC